MCTVCTDGGGDTCSDYILKGFTCTVAAVDHTSWLKASGPHLTEDGWC